MPAFILTPGLPTFRVVTQQQCARRPGLLPLLPPLRSHSRLPRWQTPRASGADTLFLSEENVNRALEEVRVKLGSVFGNSSENREIGITGDVELVEVDGPVVILRLKGRFWHKRADVLARVSAFLTQRIPEICDVSIEDVRQLDDSEEESARLAVDTL